MDKLRITVFADPVCTWCWGSAAVLRAVEYRLGEQVEIDYVMSGMIEDIRSFNNRRLEIGGDIALSNRNMMKAWLEASAVHGMPVLEHGFHLFSEEYPSTYPQNLAYITAKLCCGHHDGDECDITRANRYLRRIQEATAVEGMLTSRSEVLADLAAVEGFHHDEFLQTLNSDAAKKAFAADRERARSYEVKSFPTYLLEYRGNESILHGYKTFDELAREVDSLTGGEMTLRRSGEREDSCALTINNVKRFIKHYRSVFPVEIATAFEIKRRNGHSAVNLESYEQLPDIVDELLKSGEIGMLPIANSFIVFDIEGGTESMKRERELHHAW